MSLTTYTQRITLAGLAGLLLLAGGCLSRPNLAPSLYALNTPANVSLKSDGPVLGLKMVTVSPLFEGKYLVYRLDDNRYEKDPFAEFMVAPTRLVAASAQAHLRNSGMFREVLESSSVLTPNQRLEIEVCELYGDFRNAQAPGAVISLKFLAFEPGQGNRVLVEKTYRRQTPLKASTAAAVVAGLSQGMAEIMAEFSQDLKAATGK